jgi:ABC-type sugar transport system substrate-binding protein
MNFTRRTVLQLAAMLTSVALVPATAYAANYTIAGIVFQQDQYFRGVQIGMDTASKAASAELLSGNSDGKLEKETQLIDTYLARGVGAIVVAPLSKDGSVAALQKAHDAGIHVVTYGTTVNGDLAEASVVSSDADLGKSTGLAAKDLITKLANGGKVKIATLAFKSQLAEQSDARVNGFLDVVKDQVEVVAQQDAWLAEKAIAVASDLLTANPDVQVIYAANEGGTIGAVQAVKKAGLEGKVFVFGIDGSEQLANMLLDPDNVLQAVTAQQPLEVGRLAIEAAVALIDGKPVEKNVTVPVLALSRADTAGVEKFLADLKLMM